MKSDDLVMILTLVAVVLVLIISGLQPKFEAEAYTKLTGKHVTYWDAVWLDLRVQEGVKEPQNEKR